MKVSVYVDKLKKWVPISSDEILDRNKNLSDVKDKDAAITNLGLYDKFISKEALQSGFLPDVFTPENIQTDADHQFVSDSDKNNWNNKLNKPVEIQTNLEGASALDNIKIVNGFFSGKSQPTIIRNTKTREDGTLISPVFVDVQCVEYTGGDLGEVSVSYTSELINIYNTGSFTGAFQCMIVYPLGSVNR